MLATGYMPICSAFNPEQLFGKMRYADRMRFYSGLQKNMKNKNNKKKKEKANLSFKTDLQRACQRACLRAWGWTEDDGTGGLILKMVITYLIACIMDH